MPSSRGSELAARVGRRHGREPADGGHAEEGGDGGHSLAAWGFGV